MPDIEFTSDTSGLSSSQLTGFHESWTYRFTPDRILRSLRGSEWCLLAIHEDRVVGYVAVIGDGQTFAFVTSIEVLPQFRGQGIGRHLMEATVTKFAGRYALDILCDPDVEEFYLRLGFNKVTGMCRRNYGA